MSTHYQDDFYEGLHSTTLHPANTVLDILLTCLPSVRSAVDVGCAVGSWLMALKARGIDDIKGLDGEWVNTDLLEIPLECFSKIDLSKPFQLEKKYDLAMSLEVAEHLPASSADGFISSLTELSDFILFSAAIPFQGGTNHVNEQWLDYWSEIYTKKGFIGVDVIRKKIWHDPDIPFWYKQNLVLYVRESRVDELLLTCNYKELQPVSLVHPDQYSSPKVAMRIVMDGIKRKFAGRK